MLPALPLLKPLSIMVRNATGRLNEALDDTASDNNQAVNNPRCRRTNGQRARREPMGALAGAGVGEFIGAC